MADHFGSSVAVMSFLLLIVGALLVNALVDLGAPLREWITTRRPGPRA